MSIFINIVRKLSWTSIILLVFAIPGCDRQVEQPATEGSVPTKKMNDWPMVEFSFLVNRSNWEYTLFGEPPQLAVWLEQPGSNNIQTVWVSHRTGKNQWKGKVECPTSLPYWKSRNVLEQSGFKERTLIQRLVDALTGATPKEDFNTTVQLPPGSRWTYYIEANVSGDFNPAFPMMSEEGYPDDDGNGQPSLIYKGTIWTFPDYVSTPALLGRTDQYFAVDSIIQDLSGITTAREMFDLIEVKVSSTKNLSDKK